MRLCLHLYKSVFMTSLMTSPYHKVCQFLKLMYPHEYSARDSIKSSKYWKYSWLSCWYIPLPVLYQVKMFVATSKWRTFWKFWNIKHGFNLSSDMKRPSKIMPKKYFWRWWGHRWRHRMASNLPSIFMFRRGWFWEQVARTMSHQLMGMS